MLIRTYTNKMNRKVNHLELASGLLAILSLLLIFALAQEHTKASSNFRLEIPTKTLMENCTLVSGCLRIFNITKLTVTCGPAALNRTYYPELP